MVIIYAQTLQLHYTCMLQRYKYMPLNRDTSKTTYSMQKYCKDSKEVHRYWKNLMQGTFGSFPVLLLGKIHALGSQ